MTTASELQAAADALGKLEIGSAEWKDGWQRFLQEHAATNEQGEFEAWRQEARNQAESGAAAAGGLTATQEEARHFVDGLQLVDGTVVAGVSEEDQSSGPSAIGSLTPPQRVEDHPIYTSGVVITQEHLAVLKDPSHPLWRRLLDWIEELL